MSSFADGDLDGVADDGDLDLAAPVLRCRPGSWCRRSTRCPTSRPCGSPTPTVADGGVTVAACGRARTPAVCLSSGWRRAWVAIEHTAVVELHEPAVADDLDGLTGQPHPGLVAGGGEADRALGARPAASSPAHRRRASARRAASAGSLAVASASWNRSIGGDPPDRLVRPLVVVVPHPRVELRLGVGDRGEHLAVEELAAQRLVPPLDLAGRGRRPRRGQQVLDPVVPADPVEQHRPRCPARTGR